MSLFRRCSRSANLLFLAALVAVAASTPAAAADIAAPAAVDARQVAGPSERLVLVAEINGVVNDDPVVVHRQGNRISLSAPVLRRLGIDAKGDGPVALSSLRGVRAAINDADQTISLDVPSAPSQRVSLVGSSTNEELPPMSRSGWGAIVGYDATATRAGRRTQIAGLVDASFYTPAGHAYAGALVSTGTTARERKAVRLETGFTTADPNRMRRLTVGDGISGASSFGRPVRLGGFQLSRDFSLRPDFITFPVANVAGTAAVPSIVDLIINGTRRSAGGVRAGQFGVSDVPVRAGTNTITVAVKDALGRETLQTVSTYVSRSLLKSGLNSYSVEAGKVRLGFGTDRDRYGAATASGTFRRGLSDRLTAEAHGEFIKGTRMLAGGFTAGLGSIGQLDVGIALSRSRDGPRTVGQRSGAQVAIGFERLGGPVTLSARYVGSTKNFTDVATRYGAAWRSRSILANIGFDLGRLGSLSGGVVALSHGRAVSDMQTRAEKDRTRLLRSSTLVTGSYSVRLGERISFLATGGADARRARSFFASAGILMNFGGRTTAFGGLDAQRSSVGATVDVARRAIDPGEVGYRATASSGTINRVGAGAEYQSSSGYYEAVVERTNGSTAARVSTRGAMIITAAGVSMANRRAGSVALVDTNGVAGVRIYRDNRFAGVTDRRGRLTIAGLNPFQPTKLAIDPAELDNEIVLTNAELFVRPYDRAGAAVHFDLHRSRAIITRLLDPAGAALPASSYVERNGGIRVPVGVGGEVYLEDAGAGFNLSIRLPNGQQCFARIEAAPAGAPHTKLEAVRCKSILLAAKP